MKKYFPHEIGVRVLLHSSTRLLLISIFVDSVFSFLIFPKIQSLFGDVDGEGYGRLATSLLSCGTFTYTCGNAPTIFRGPGYPAFLAFINIPWSSIVYLWVIAVQIIMNAVAAILVYRIAAILYNKATAQVAFTLFLLIPVLHVFIPRYHVENMLQCMLLAVMYILFFRKKEITFSTTLIAGIVLGCSIMVKQTLLFLPLLLAIALGRRYIRHAAVLVAVSYAVVFPWTLRNYHLSGSLIPVHTNAGMNLVIGNTVVTHFMQTPFQGLKLWQKGNARVHVIAPFDCQETATVLLEKESTYLNAGLAELKDPFFALYKIGLNTVLFFSLGTSLLNSCMLLVPAVFVLFWIPAGLRHSEKMTKQVAILLMVTVYTIAVHVGIYAIGRFSIVILPLMAIISARGIVTSRCGARFLSLVE